jgi:tetrahydromethanopterin S-methyltransferase subunit A
MSAEPTGTLSDAVAAAQVQLRSAAQAKKCWACACLHNSLKAIKQALPTPQQPQALAAVMRSARQRLVEPRYDCLGCEVCYPAIAVNALNEGGLSLELDTCPTEEVRERDGWPPLPGDYKVRRYHAPVAVCTLTESALADTIASAAGPELAIVGTLQTENLGIERLIRNLVANPHVRFLLVCGPDSRMRIGHLPGQSLLALARSGVAEGSRIIGAPGKRPVLRNIARQAVDQFRRTVEVVDLVGTGDHAKILDALQDCAARDPGPAEPFAGAPLAEVVRGFVPERMIPDPAGYFVVYVDRRRGLISLEHYTTDGVLDVVLEGAAADELSTPAVERGLISRLDHAAYLGRELARAERALHSGDPYVQDGAPERAAQSAKCGCGPSCGG